MSEKCKECSASFEISKEELDFLEKISPTYNGISYQIPKPVFCPTCRLIARTLHRNEQYFHHNKSVQTGKQLISLYDPNSSFSSNYKILSDQEWWSDSWDALEYGRDYDFSKTFFEQYYQLLLDVPRLNLMQMSNENCPYTTGTGHCKDCHLINSSEHCENCYYGKLFQKCRDVLDSAFCYDSELLYQCFSVLKCYSCVYLSYSQNCIDCYFSENLKGCKNCFLCTNLQNKEFYFQNQPLSKEEYQKKTGEFLGTKQGVEKAQQILEKLKDERIHKYANVINSENSSGDFLSNCKNCIDSYDLNESENCRYVTVGVNVFDQIDCSNMYLKSQLSYQVLGTLVTYNVIFSLYIFYSQNVAFSQSCFNSKDLFACVGLSKKENCIFNKQYTKTEYEELCSKIIKHMQGTGEWGSFFPAMLSPFGYNQSLAQEYFPLTKEQAMEKGFYWLEADKKSYKTSNYSFPASIAEVKDDVLNEILACATCGKNYKIIPQELKKLREFKLPLPEDCPDCRFSSRAKLRNPRKLWKRKCCSCGLQIETTFENNQQALIYCEDCYLKEVF